MTPIRFAIMPTSRRVPGFLRFLVSRFVLQVAVGALLTACAWSPQRTEDFGSTSSALGVAGLFSTGVDATGTPLAIGDVDPHYVLSSDDPARPGPNALVIAPASGWIGSTLTSNWIGAQANGVAATAATYTYTTTFTLSGLDPTKVILSGSWACDGTCVINLNGTVVASSTASASMAVAAFSIPVGSPFVTGTNTLSFVVTSSSDGTSGLQVVSISGTSFRCTADNQCGAAQFCNTQTGSCVPTLANGTPIPTISGHTPVLNGVCASGVGASVCDAGVCDMSNNECGLANGNGPCTVTNGATLCQSGACSVNDTCEPQGGCNVDGDCTGRAAVRYLEPPVRRAARCGRGCDGGSGRRRWRERRRRRGRRRRRERGPGCERGGDGSQDGAVGSDGSEGEDGSAAADGTAARRTPARPRTARQGSDGSAVEDGNARDASEEDATARAGEDASEEGADGGVNPHKVLEGDGLSCSAARSGSGTTSGLPLWVLGVAVAATMRRRRRDATRRGACPARPTCLRPSAGDRCE